MIHLEIYLQKQRQENNSVNNCRPKPLQSRSIFFCLHSLVSASQLAANVEALSSWGITNCLPRTEAKLIIKKAKVFAKKNHISLSQLFESYLINLVNEKDSEIAEISPLVKSLSGVLRLPANSGYRKDRTKFLEKKYK